MKQPNCIGVVAHPRRPASFPVADEVAASLKARGLTVWSRRSWGAIEQGDISPGTDMVVVIGGDGAMLRAARICAIQAIPVIGINMGYLGFLPEVNSPEAWDKHIDRLVAGDYWVERRMMIAASVIRDGQVIARGDSLNDVVITRTKPMGTVLLQTYIDNYWATTYHADALIIATPTGSTAYALASGGPILPPQLHNILIVPVAAHLSMDRSIVLSEGATVQVVISPEREHDATVVLDGVTLTDLEPSDIISIRVSENQGLFVRLRERNYFYRSLLDRLEPRVPSRATPEPDHLQIHTDTE